MSRSRTAARRRASAFLSLLLCAATPAALRAATVSTIDGRVLSGPELVFDAKAATITVGSASVALGDCDWVEPGTGAGLGALPAKPIGVWLADGSWLPVTELRAAHTENQLSIDGPLGAVDVPLANLLGWSFSGDLPAVPAETKDSDQLQLESGVVPGHIVGLADGKLQVRLDLDPDKTQAFPLEQVRGLRLALAAPPHAGKGLSLSVAISDTRPALRLAVVGAGPAESCLRLAAAQTVAIGKGVINARLRIEGGRRVYLGSLDPDHVDEVGAFGVTWPWKRDSNLDGSPLRLGGVRYDHGLVVHSQAKLVWKLQGAYVKLHALAGIADVVGDQGDCAASLVADGKTLWQRDSVKGGEKPLLIDLDLSGAQVLELHVDYGARYDIGDHFALADAFLVRAK